MKLIHVTDTHLAPIGTRFRKEGFEDALFSKLNHVIQYAQEHNAPVIHTGDLFDLQNPRGVPRELIVRFQDLLATGNTDWYILTGQHDLQGRDPSTFRRCPVALLSHHPNVKALSGGEVLTPVDLGEGNTLFLVPFSNQVYEVLHQLTRLKEAEKPTILATHAMLTLEEVPWKHMLLSELKGVAPFVLSGDLHSGFDVTQIGSTIFSNPGALARGDRSEAGRTPQVALVDLTDHSVRYLPIDHLPPEEAFDLGAIEEHITLKERRSEFAAKLSGVGLETALSWEAIVTHLPEEEHHVIERARGYYDRALETVSS